MTFALTLLVLLAPGDEPLAGSLAAATRATLGADATLELRIVSQPLDDAEAVAQAEGSQAAAVAVIEWADVVQQHARIRLYARSSGRWIERALAFTPSDVPEEKGRTLGFTLASMLPETAAAIARTEPSATPAAPAPEQAGPNAQPPPEQAQAGPSEAPPVAAAPVPPPASSPVPPAEPSAPPPWTFGIDIAAQGTLALGGEGTSAGGTLGGRIRLGPHLALRAGAGLRVGHIERLEATLLAVELGPSLLWRSNDAEPGRPWSFGMGLSAFARLQSINRPADDTRPAEAHGHFVPGVGVGVEVMYALSAEWGLIADFGGQALLGETDVLLHGRPIATLAPVELVAALGASARF